MCRRDMRSIGRSIATNIVPVIGQSISCQIVGTKTFMFLVGMANIVMTMIVGMDTDVDLGTNTNTNTTECRPR